MPRGAKFPLKTLLLHPSGNTFSRALLRGLVERDMLGLFVTSIVARKSAPLVRLLPEPLRREILRREFEAPAGRVWSRPWREWGRIFASRLGLKSLTQNETGWLSWEAVFSDLDRFVARSLESAVAKFGVSTVYCYEDAALHVFGAARRLGLRSAYDLPIAYWETGRRLMQEERERLPEWDVTMPGTRDSQRKLDRKTAELELADVVVCPSKFVYDSLPAWCRDGKRCMVAEFGSPPVAAGAGERVRQAGQPLRVLFAGSMTQRKGLADVFEAMKILKRNDVQLVVFGSPVAPMEFYRGQFPDFIHEPPRPHEEVLRLMETCDVLVLPSIVEGRALVQQEAMSRGLPLIITRNTGGEDLVEDGKAGFLVPIRAPGRIAECIAWFADHPEELRAMQEHACRAAGRLTWDGYAEKIITGIAP